ncbi:MAG: cupredoxin domain-containing protein [Candidatus Pacearchaeota archaeon]
MKKYIGYVIGIVLIVSIFGFIMVKGNSSSLSEVYSAPVVNGIQEVTLSLKDYNYYPNTLKVKSGIPVRIYLDSSVVGCLRSFTVNEFGVNEYLATTEDYVEFTPDKTGNFAFACSMNMGTGALIVE